MSKQIDLELLLDILRDYQKWFDENGKQCERLERQIALIENSPLPAAHLGVIRCTDGDCLFQFDETCHKPEIQIDDSHRCASRETEIKIRGDEM